MEDITGEPLLSKLPRVVYDGPIDGPGTELVLVFDCPVPDGEGFIFGRLFVVGPKPTEADMIVYPAARTPEGELVAGRPYGELLGISPTSVDDALDDARARRR